MGGAGEHFVGAKGVELGEAGEDEDADGGGVCVCVCVDGDGAGRRWWLGGHFFLLAVCLCVCVWWRGCE